MPKIALTDISIRSLKKPEKGQITYWDNSLAGFGVRVSQGGSKSFVLIHGATRQRTTIGRVGIIKLTDARTEAKRILAENTLGRHRPVSITYEEALRRFLTASKAKNKPRTTNDYKRLLSRHFRFSRTHVEDITSREIQRKPPVRTVSLR